MLRSVTILLTIFCLHTAPAVSAQNWQTLAKPTQANLRKLFFLNSSTGWVAGASGAILKTTDGGKNWITLDSRVSSEIVDIFMLNEQLGWALTLDQPSEAGALFGTIVLKTLDGGANWERGIFRDEYFFGIAFIDSLHGWMGGENGSLVASTDGGTTWEPATVDSSLFTHWQIRSVKFLTPQLGFATGGHIDIVGVVWRTTNGGESWSADGAGGEPINDVFFIDSLNMVSVGGDFDYGAGVHRSTDGGVSWDYVNPFIWGEARAVSFRTRSEAWVPLGFAGTMMCTQDSGRTWRDMFTPDSSAVYDVVFLDSTTGFMVGDAGTILKYDPTAVDVPMPAVSGLPSSFALHQNYPNPFNPSTVIEYELPVPALVTLRVYNMLGEEVSTLVRERQGTGSHRAVFSGERRPSGVYICRLNAGDRVAARKMLLIR